MKKNGKQLEIQRYICTSCGFIFQNKRRKARKAKALWKEYSGFKQTYKNLQIRYNLSKPTIQKLLDRFPPTSKSLKPRAIVLVIDTMYFNRLSGLMVFRDILCKENLLWKCIERETVYEMRVGVKHLLDQGFKIVGIVTDGKGLKQDFFGIPIQMCQFHQQMIVTRYITKRPRLEASRELKEISLLLTKTDKSSFSHWLDQWYEKWKEFFKEKTIDPITKREHYTHRRTRSAYYSLKRNLDYLFTYQDYPKKKIPNTTNSIESVFQNLKTNLRIHRGLKFERKMKLITEILTKNSN